MPTKFYSGDAASRKRIEDMLNRELEKPDPDIALVSDLLDILVPEEPDAETRQRIWKVIEGEANSHFQ